VRLLCLEGAIHCCCGVGPAVLALTVPIIGSACVSGRRRNTENPHRHHAYLSHLSRTTDKKQMHNHVRFVQAPSQDVALQVDLIDRSAAALQFDVMTGPAVGRDRRPCSWQLHVIAGPCSCTWSPALQLDVITGPAVGRDRRPCSWTRSLARQLHVIAGPCSCTCSPALQLGVITGPAVGRDRRPCTCT
jgi:hypothetical protein